MALQVDLYAVVGKHLCKLQLCSFLLSSDNISCVHALKSFFMYSEKCTPGEVTNIEFSADDSRITISWNEPDTGNLNTGMFIEGYEVRYNYMDEWIVRETIQTSWEVNYLLPGTRVMFEVRAKCSCGKIGPPLHAVHSTSEGVYATLTKLVVLLHWYMYDSPQPQISNH